MNIKIIVGVVFALVVVGYVGNFFAPQEPHDAVRAEKADLIIVDQPLPGAAVSSPFTASGRARGNWYFEASFPVILKDENGNILAQVPATAKSEWMTTEFVPFEVTFTFKAPPSGTRGALIFQKDNPSGLPEFDDALEFPVVFE